MREYADLLMENAPMQEYAKRLENLDREHISSDVDQIMQMLGENKFFLVAFSNTTALTGLHVREMFQRLRSESLGERAKKYDHIVAEICAFDFATRLEIYEEVFRMYEEDLPAYEAIVLKPFFMDHMLITARMSLVKAGLKDLGFEKIRLKETLLAHPETEGRSPGESLLLEFARRSNSDSLAWAQLPHPYNKQVNDRILPAAVSRSACWYGGELILPSDLVIRQEQPPLHIYQPVLTSRPSFEKTQPLLLRS